MARDRGTSLLHVQEEASSVFGLKVPDVIRKLVPILSQVDKNLLRKLIQVAVKDIEKSEIQENAFRNISVDNVSEETLMHLYSGILQLLKIAFRAPCGTLKQEAFKKELLELKMPKEFVTDICSVVFSSKQQDIDQKCIENRIRLPRLESLRWRVDVAISTSVLNRVLEPTIMMEMKLDNNQTATFEVPVSKFHELRYNVASVLKEMEDLEKRNVLKIHT